VLLDGKRMIGHESQHLVTKAFFCCGSVMSGSCPILIPVLFELNVKKDDGSGWTTWSIYASGSRAHQDAQAHVVNAPPRVNARVSFSAGELRPRKITN